MHRAQTAQGLLQPVRQRVIGGVHARKHRIAARRRNVDCIERRTDRRRALPGEIGVPHIGARAVAVTLEQLDARVGRVVRAEWRAPVAIGSIGLFAAAGFKERLGGWMLEANAAPGGSPYVALEAALG